MKTLFFKRPTFALLAMALWLCFASLPPGETRQLYLKVTGQITGTPNIKVNNSTFKQNSEADSRFVLDIGQSITVTDVVSVVTNGVFVTNGFTNVATSTVTNTITNATADAISALLVDPQGNVISTFFEFDTIHGIHTSESSEKVFATGTGIDSITDASGDISFSDVTLWGRIEFTADGEPKTVTGTMRANGDVDGSDFVFNGKVTADNPFVAAPTNFNQSARPR